MTVDPLDDCSFWYTNEYLPVTAAFDWRTRIVDMRFRSCGNLPPIAALAAEGIIECDTPAGGRMLLDASASTDPDSLPGTNDDIVRFEWFSDLGGEDELALGLGEQLQVTLPLGISRVTLVVTDSEGHEDTADLEIEVIDTTPPVLSIELRPTALWPPNHQLVEIVAEVTARDDCDVEVVLESVTSSEPDEGPGQSSGDVQGVEAGTLDLTFQVRAERSEGGSGRVYTATYRAVDASGNAALGSGVVAVPRDRSGDVLSFGFDPGVLSLIDENGDVFALLGPDPDQDGGVLFSLATPTAVPAASAAALAALAALLAAVGALRSGLTLPTSSL